jgi:hypothetical protein
MTTQQLLRHLSVEAAKPVAALINTPLQRVVGSVLIDPNRFNGLKVRAETVNTVQLPSCSAVTPLKRGVREDRALGTRIYYR